jgi:hypothetical protein
LKSNFKCKLIYSKYIYRCKNNDNWISENMWSYRNINMWSNRNMLSNINMWSYRNMW